MPLTRRITLALAGTLSFAAQVAQAHVYGAHDAGFAAGIAHPFLGLDHLAALVAVGLWAAQLGGHARWLVPAAFVSMMAAGCALGLAGVLLPMAEPAVAASVLVLGLLILFAARLPTSLGMALTGVFAVFHGYSHGTELPEAAAPWLYAGGFLLATLTLHIAGLLTGSALRDRYAWIVRATGALLAGGGAFMLTG